MPLLTWTPKLGKLFLLLVHTSSTRKNAILLARKPTVKRVFILRCNQQMALAAEAIRGHMSAHSLATGPATAEPFISPLGLTITPALSTTTNVQICLQKDECKTRASLGIQSRKMYYLPRSIRPIKK